jgi:hypothetical protein
MKKVSTTAAKPHVGDSGCDPPKNTFMIVNGYSAEIWMIGTVRGTLPLYIRVPIIWCAA